MRVSFKWPGETAAAGVGGDFGAWAERYTILVETKPVCSYFFCIHGIQSHCPNRCHGSPLGQTRRGGIEFPPDMLVLTVIAADDMLISLVSDELNLAVFQNTYNKSVRSKMQDTIESKKRVNHG